MLVFLCGFSVCVYSHDSGGMTYPQSWFPIFAIYSLNARRALLKIKAQIKASSDKK